MKKYLSEILQLLGSERRKLPVMILFFIFASLLEIMGLSLIGPYVSLLVEPDSLVGPLEWGVDMLDLPRDPKWLLSTLGISLIVLYLIKAVVAIWLNYIITRFGLNQQVILRSRLMKTYQALPYTEYLLRNSSEYIHSIQRLSEYFSNQVVMTLLRTISDGILGIAIIVLLAWTNGMALFILIGLLSMVVIIYDRIFRQNLRSYGRKGNKAEINMVQSIHEGIEGLKEIRVLGCEAYFHHKMVGAAKQYAYCHTFRQVISTAPRYLLEALMITFIVLLTLVMLKSQQKPEELLPTLGVFAFAAMRLLPTVNVFSNSLHQLRFARDAVVRLCQDLVRDKSDPSLLYRCSDRKKEPDDTFQVLSMQSVSFCYPNSSRDALHKVTLEINSGESIGIIGVSGSGKSTLADMILGILEPYEGKVLMNGNSMSLGFDAWRAQVAYLLQQVFLIDNTIRRNVALGIEDEYIDDDKISEALRQARLSDLVKELPEGVDTMMGERGIRLSGGQRQRVALARAFYHGRNILIMDEATSALDNETEHEIVEEINYLKGKKTLIVIAHRMSTIQQCDRIYRFDQGEIVSYGTPNQVVINKS